MPSPMVPLPPPWFSMITGWPKAVWRRGCSVRASVSIRPPAAKPTITRSGFDGYDCADAVVAASAAAATNIRITFILSSSAADSHVEEIHGPDQLVVDH